MKIGIYYPQSKLKGDPEALDRIGRAVEELGYDHVTMADHVLGAVHEDRDPPINGPYNEKDAFHDPFVAFGYLAGITSRIELITGAIVLPQRQTVIVAKQATEIDLLSRGRLRLGVSVGWNRIEYEALGQDFHTRGRRLDEQISYLRRLWSEPLVSFEGRFDRVDRASVLPHPKRMIPIWIGGFTEPGYRRAAKLGDGYLFAGGPYGDPVQEWRRLRELLAAEGRSAEGFDAHCSIMETSKGELRDSARRWQDTGGTYVAAVPIKSYDEVQPYLDFYADAREQLRGL